MPDQPTLGGSLGDSVSKDDFDGVKYNGTVMRKFSFGKGSFNTLFTLISDPDEFFKEVEEKLDAL